MLSKDNNPKKNKKSWVFYTFLLLFFLKKIFQLKGRKYFRKIEKNFKKFLKKEEKEIKEYTGGKEDFEKFAKDSSNIFKDYFVPHSGNNHTPYILRTRSLAIMAILTVLIKFSLVAYLYFIYPNPGMADAELIARVLELINKDRQTQNIGTLSIDPVLSESAEAKANDIIENDYFAHISPDGKKPWDWVDRGRYAYMIVGENLAMNFSSADSVHRALMNSPSHKKNIMNEKYQDIGLAVVEGDLEGKNTKVLVQIFSTRSAIKPLEPATEVVVKENKALIEDKDVEVLASEASEEEEIKEVADNEPGIAEKKDEQEVLDNEPEIVKKKDEVELLVVKDNGARVVDISDKKERKISTSTIATNEKVEKPIKVIRHPGDDVLQRSVKESIDYELALMAEREKSLPGVNVSTENINDDNYILSAGLIKAAQMALASILSLMIISLIINIFVRFEIQHKPVLLRSLVLVIFIVALLFVNLHYLEGGTSVIYMS